MECLAGHIGLRSGCFVMTNVVSYLDDSIPTTVSLCLINMFCSIVVLNKDLTSQLVVKHMGISTKAAENVMEALRDSIDQDSKPENGVIASKTNNEYGIFIETNDVIILGVTEEEVHIKYYPGQSRTGFSTSLFYIRPYQNRSGRSKVY